MLDVLNAIYLAAILISSITLYPTDETPVPMGKDAFVELKLHREWWRDDGKGKCSYSGVLVPYTRTWSEEVRRGEEIVILLPEPDKIAGYVVVANRKLCDGKAAESILRAGTPSTRKPFFGKRQVDLHTFFQAGDMLQTPPDKMPPWMPQVIDRMSLLAKTDKNAQRFIVESLPELHKALPGLPSLEGY
ncbi:hypothetical protein JAB6_29360 [Janthinobacterium sp. HH104]|uniref:hypothetical protein n=1 Tax=Janthinobacterium sp. HH104 TaxID=1537276 RepID=UPI000874FB8B|nr:hypothetical protein [Janthinobacterium sp. HH104]OEZ83359.1 hypothetical protein JAB6_29360 [Janthinobacterium sp. HH104]